MNHLCTHCAATNLPASMSNERLEILDADVGMSASLHLFSFLWLQADDVSS